MAFASHSVFIAATWIAAVFGSIGVGAAFVSAIVGYRLTETSLSDANVRISEADARAKEAELALIKFRKPRSELLTPEVRAGITEKLKPFAGTKFDIGYGREDREQADFLWWLLPTINDARWVHLDWMGGEVFKRHNWPGDHRMGVMAVINVSIKMYPESREKLKPAADALVAALKSTEIEAAIGDFNNSSINNDAIHLLVGPKR